MSHLVTRRRLAAATTSAVLLGLCVPLLGGAAASAAPLPAPVPVPSPQAPVKQVVLDWAPVAGASSYVVQVGQDETWSGVPTLELTTVATRLTLPVWLPHADYAWRVAAVQDGVRGRWSTGGASTTFTRAWPDRPTPLTPAADSTSTTRPTFSWSPVPGASEYQLQMSNSPTFDETPPPGAGPTTDNGGTQTQSSIATDSCFTTRTVLTPSTTQAAARNGTPGACSFTLLDTGPLYWRVRPLDQVAGEVQEVDTTPVSDEGISHLPPDPEAEGLDLSGCPVPDADPAASPTASGTPGATATATATPTVTPSGTASPSAAPTTAAACEPQNPVEKGAWSPTTRFFLQFPQAAPADYRAFPLVRTGALPTGTCTSTGSCTDFPTITWEAVPGATRYRLYVALDAAYSNVQEIVESSALQWTPNTQFRQSGVRSSYFYVVQACTTEGCGAVTSTPPSFRIGSPPVTGLTEQVTREEVVLSWTDYAATLSAGTGAAATSEAYAYRVQVAQADDEDFTGELVDDAVVDATHHVSADEDYGDGTFRWRVQALDASGHPLPWSAARRFVRDSTPPTVVRVAPTSAVDALANVAVRFSEPVSGVSSTTVRLGGVPATVRMAEPTLAVLDPVRALAAGGSYVLTVDGLTDKGGNRIAPSTTTVTVNKAADDAHGVVGYAGAWGTARSSEASGGRFHVASRGAAATFPVYGTGVVLGGCVGPASGLYEVWVDGTRLVRADAFRTYSGCTALTTVKGLPRGFHTVQLRVVGAKRTASRGTAVGFDALRVLP